MIQLKDVSFQYGERTVLDHVSLDVLDSKCTVIDGPNGCGKSTLFRIINGLEFARTGEYLLDGESITKEKMKDETFAKKLHKKIGYLFQDSEMQLFTSSVEDEIAFGLFQLGMDRDKIQNLVEKYIDLLGLQEVRKSAPFNLSGGEKKRCALAAVLAMEPEILVLDEPISGLDEDGQEWITSFLDTLKEKGKTILIASHQKDFIASVADITISMDKYHHVVNVVEK